MYVCMYVYIYTASALFGMLLYCSEEACKVTQNFGRRFPRRFPLRVVPHARNLSQVERRPDYLQEALHHMGARYLRGPHTKAVGCGVCDTPKLWRGAAGLCACVRACGGAAESLNTYIHTHRIERAVDEP